MKNKSVYTLLVIRYDKQGRELQEEDSDHEEVAPEEFTTNTEPVDKWTNEKPPRDEWTNGKPSDDWNSQGDADWSTERVDCPRSLIIDETEYSETQMVRFHGVYNILPILFFWRNVLPLPVSCIFVFHLIEIFLR